MPSSSVYRARFGSLIRAYQLIGYDPGRDYQYIETNRAIWSMFPGVLAETVAKIEEAGGTVQFNKSTDILTINEEFTASIIIARRLRSPTGFLRWKLRLDTGLRPDITIAIRMDGNNETILDYYLLPSMDILSDKLRLAEETGSISTPIGSKILTLSSILARVISWELPHDWSIGPGNRFCSDLSNKGHQSAVA